MPSSFDGDLEMLTCNPGSESPDQPALEAAQSKQPAYPLGRTKANLRGSYQSHARLQRQWDCLAFSNTY